MRGFLLSLLFVPITGLSSWALAGISEGQQLYDAYCQVCHGGVGEGLVMGKPLTDSVANRQSDEELLAVIRDGRAGTGMAAWGSSMSDEEIFDIASYVRVLQSKPPLSEGSGEREASDDPAVLAGEQLFNGPAECSTCHSYADQGGNVGPALDAVAARLSVAALLEALLNPSASIVSGFAAKLVEQTDGSQIRGRFRNDSELAVQIQSEDGSRWLTYFKDRVASITDLEESLMPDTYATLGAEQQESLLAFLKSL